MYYHCRPLKYVTYGKIFPPPIESIDSDWGFADMYRWLGRHCGYCPQVWLSRSRSSITGYGYRYSYSSRPKRRKKDGTWESKRTWTKKDEVLFGFENIQGFPLSFDLWEMIMNMLIGEKDFKKQNSNIVRFLNEIHRETMADGYPIDPEIQAWIDSGRNLDRFLKEHLFVEVDQVVVPSLNLKAAKKIICWDERQKKKLRKMGFIEDRIHIKNFKRPQF
jgi:hypothetical protein